MFPKTWKVAAIAASISSAYASDNIQPLFTSLPPAAQQQASLSTPLALTKAHEQQINSATFATKMFPLEDKVWMLSEHGVSILERTSTGLVSRASLNVEDLKLGSNGGYRFLISPNGKKVLILNLWGNNTNGYTEVELSDDYKLTSKKGTIDSNVTYIDDISPLGDRSFITRKWNNGTYTNKYYSLDNDGIKYSGAIQGSSSNNSIYSEKTKTVFSMQVNYNWPDVTATIFATKFSTDGRVTNTNAKITNSKSSGFDQTLIFDEVTNNIIITSNTDAYVLKYDPTSNSFASPTITPNSTLFGQQTNINIRGVISNDYKMTDSGSEYVKRTNSGYTYQKLDLKTNDIRDKSLIFNSISQQLEFWTLGSEGQGVTQFILKDGQSSKGISQNKTELGFSNILHGGNQISSADSPLLFVSKNSQIEVYKFDNNKLVRLNSDILPYNSYRPDQNITYLGDNKYLAINYSKEIRIFKENEGNTLALLDTLDASKHIINFDNEILASGNNIITLTGDQLVLFNFDGSKITYTGRASKTSHELLNNAGKAKLVKLFNKTYLLQPEVKRYLEVSVTDRLINLKVAGKMPFINITSVESASDRLFAKWNYNSTVTLMQNLTGDLVPSAIEEQTTEKRLFKNRFAVNKVFSPYLRNFNINDSVTGIWSEALVSTCCEDFSNIYVTNNTLVAYNVAPPQKLTTYKINSAPYLPVTQPELLLNQGVNRSVNLAAVVTDDEKDSLTFSGSLPAGFTVDKTGSLKFDGTTAGSGHYTVSVSDGGLAADLRLPYRINAAPALEKELPTITVNEKQKLNFDLSTYFSDVEGQAISFSAEPLKGFSVSKAGLITGVPVDTSSTELTFRTTDAGSAVSSHKIVINVNATPVWTNVTSQSFNVGDVAKIELAAAFSDREGNPLTFQAINLPAGLSLSGSTITGSPTQSGEFNVTIQATDSGGAVGSGTFNITVYDKKSGGSYGSISLAMLAGLAIWRRRQTRKTH